MPQYTNMFHTCVLRFSGAPLTDSSPLGGGILLPSASTDAVFWDGAAADLANAHLLANPVSVQWVVFDAQEAAQQWVASAEAQTVLATSLVSGYWACDDGNPMNLVVHRWKAWSASLPSMSCTKCPPTGLAGGTQLPAFVGQPLAGLAPSVPVQTTVLHFADAASLSSYLSGNPLYLANTLCAQHLTT
ncbi:hypothetical protein [Ideonella dechloratans]|uniref:hypothetical protein n=1 Tax=Ideonella dechloratans TaxID=36863 RepID=UPI0035AE87E0